MSRAVYKSSEGKRYMVLCSHRVHFVFTEGPLAKDAFIPNYDSLSELFEAGWRMTDHGNWLCPVHSKDIENFIDR